MDMTPYLQLMADKKASDLFFCTGAVPQVKIQGRIRPIGTQKLMPGDTDEIASSVMNEAQKKEFNEVLEMNIALSMQNIGRFRVNVFRQRGQTSIVIRYIQTQIPYFDDVNLPAVLGDMIMEKSGLILVVGPTGSGKSTTLASMIGHRNRNSHSHILTIEDPLEYIHKHDKSIVQQREVGIDTLSYDNALSNAVREAPDVIMIGEIRDMTTMKHAITYAETGHLCIATLHSNNACQALDRILNFYPESMHRQVHTDLSMNLRAIVSQRLVSAEDGSRLPAVEILNKSPYIEELIASGDFAAIKEAMKDETDDGTISLDRALLKLYFEEKITMEEAIANAGSKNDVSVAIREVGVS